MAATYLAFDHPLLDKRIQLSCAVDETMKNLFEQFGWQGHLPLIACERRPLPRLLPCKHCEPAHVIE